VFAATPITADQARPVDVSIPPATPSGDVTAALPLLAIAPSDGPPVSLVGGRSYELRLHVWAASNGRPGLVSVSGTGFSADGCTRRPVPVGRVTTVRCRVVPQQAASRSGSGVRIDVQLRADGIEPVSTAFVHPVVGTG
jgi:hypothetical protein